LLRKNGPRACAYFAAAAAATALRDCAVQHSCVLFCSPEVYTSNHKTELLDEVIAQAAVTSTSIAQLRARTLACLAGCCKASLSSTPNNRLPPLLVATACLPPSQAFDAVMKQLGNRTNPNYGALNLWAWDSANQGWLHASEAHTLLLGHNKSHWVNLVSARVCYAQALHHAVHQRRHTRHVHTVQLFATCLVACRRLRASCWTRSMTRKLAASGARS
jgi:hypothetical protein